MDHGVFYALQMVKQQISEPEITFILWHFVPKGNKNFTVGSQQKIRVSRVTGNTYIFFTPNRELLATAANYIE